MLSVIHCLLLLMKRKMMSIPITKIFPTAMFFARYYVKVLGVSNLNYCESFICRFAS